MAVYVVCKWGSRRAGDGGQCGPLVWPCVHVGSNDTVFRWLSLLCGREGSFHETVPRKSAENTVKHGDGGVDSVVANHCDGSERSVVVTTLIIGTVHAE